MNKKENSSLLVSVIETLESTIVKLNLHSYAFTVFYRRIDDLELDMSKDMDIKLSFEGAYSQLSKRLLQHLNTDYLIQITYELLREAEEVWEKENIDNIYKAWDIVSKLVIEKDNEYLTMEDIGERLSNALNWLRKQ